MATTRLYTVQELEESPPEGEWELIDGELIPVMPSGFGASSLGHRIGRIIGNFVDAHDLGAVTGADGGYVLFPDQETLRVPDVGFVARDRLALIDDPTRFPRLAPDLAVEVLSPSDRIVDALAKVTMYLQAGVRMVWLVSPTSRTVTVFQTDADMVQLSEVDTLDGGDLLPGFSIRVAELLG